MMARTPVFLVMIGMIDAHNDDHTHTHNDDHIHTRNGDHTHTHDDDHTHTHDDDYTHTHDGDHQKSAYIITAIMAPVCLFRAII